MERYLVPIGIVWVVLAIIVGALLLMTAPEITAVPAAPQEVVMYDPGITDPNTNDVAKVTVHIPEPEVTETSVTLN